MESLLNLKKIPLDSIKLYNNLPDIYNYFIEFTEDNKIILDLNSGFSIQPRKLYLYDIKMDTLIKTIETSIAAKEIKLINYKSEIFFLLSRVFASGNTVSLKEQLIELDNFKDTMTSTIVHDLKNPLNTIINLSKEAKIRQPAYNMLNLVMNILDVQKYEDNKMELNFEECYLSEILENAKQKVKLLLAEKK